MYPTRWILVRHTSLWENTVKQPTSYGGRFAWIGAEKKSFGTSHGTLLRFLLTGVYVPATCYLFNSYFRWHMAKTKAIAAQQPQSHTLSISGAEANETRNALANNQSPSCKNTEPPLRTFILLLQTKTVDNTKTSIFCRGSRPPDVICQLICSCECQAGPVKSQDGCWETACHD